MSSTTSESSTKSVLSYAARVDQLLKRIDPCQLERIVERLDRARRAGEPVYLAGNGGSAANASHLTLHLREAGLLAIDMNQGPLLTAISNDSDFDFCYQFQATVPGLAVLFSVSGESHNVCTIALNLSAIAFVGVTESSLAKRAELPLALGSRDYAAVEDAHSCIVHLITEALDKLK